MRMPNGSQRKLLERACSKYQSDLILADSFLNGRGVSLATAERWRLGVVSSPEPGHESAVGRLAIPYLNKAGVLAFKFRCISHTDCKAEGCTKYLCPDGQEKYLFNVAAVDSSQDIIHITEGEFDCIALTEGFGEPAVGVPGTGVWMSHWPYHFQSFARVIVWPDGDKAGKDWGNRMRKEIEGAEIVSMPPGKDVEGLLLEVGAEALRELAGLNIDSDEVAHA